MSKKSARNANHEPRRGDESIRPATVPPRQERPAKTMDLVELKPGLFLNVDQIVSVRVLPQEEGNVYAIMQLSNGDKQNLTRDEFTAITGEEPRPEARRLQNPQVK